MLPTLQQTHELYNFAVSKTNILNLQMGLPQGISGVHYQNVAYVAATIAQAANLDPQKAYIVGLLHDYGEYIEDTIPHTFHGTAGYDQMMQKGFDEVARVCLTHSFFEGIYSPDNFAYESAEIIRAGTIISGMTLDDYDYLVQIADLMSPNLIIDTVENRIHMITEKYKIPPDLAAAKLTAAQNLKARFEQKYSINIYSLFHL